MITDFEYSRNGIDGVGGVATPQMRFRCPHCQKLYHTSSDVFDEEYPEFDCAQCDKAFKLKNQTDGFGLYKTEVVGIKSFDTCPKCSKLKPLRSDECPSCGVLASKYLEAQKVESPALYELNLQWQKVLNNFGDDLYHQDFINKCHLKMALNFAYQKYADLQKTIGFDAFCEKYIRQIELRLEQQFKTKKPLTDSEIEKIVDKREMSLSQMFFIALGSVGLLLLIYNRYVPTFPNFNGPVLLFTLVAFAIGLFSDSRKQTL